MNYFGIVDQQVYRIDLATVNLVRFKDNGCMLKRDSLPNMIWYSDNLTLRTCKILLQFQLELIANAHLK